MTAILINPFDVPEGITDDAFLRGWERVADYMRQQPGFVSSRLHRALSPDAPLVHQSRRVGVCGRFRAAVSSGEFAVIAKGAPAGAPFLYESCESCSSATIRVVQPLWIFGGRLLDGGRYVASLARSLETETTRPSLSRIISVTGIPN